MVCLGGPLSVFDVVINACLLLLLRFSSIVFCKSILFKRTVRKDYGRYYSWETYFEEQWSLIAEHENLVNFHKSHYDQIWWGHWEVTESNLLLKAGPPLSSCQVYYDFVQSDLERFQAWMEIPQSIFHTKPKYFYEVRKHDSLNFPLFTSYQCEWGIDKLVWFDLVVLSLPYL